MSGPSRSSYASRNASARLEQLFAGDRCRSLIAGPRALYILRLTVLILLVVIAFSAGRSDRSKRLRGVVSDASRRLHDSSQPFLAYGGLSGERLARDVVAPWDPQWNNSIAVCAIMAHEHLEDVREWLQYNRWLGIGHVYLVDNAPHEGKSTLASGLSDFVQSGFLTLTVDPQPWLLRHPQLAVYSKCIRDFKHKHNWLAFFDIDEFLAVRDQSRDLASLLDEYKYYPGLVVQWITFGPDGRKKRPKDGGVLRHYTSCDPKPNKMIKTIANTFYVVDSTFHPHNFEFRGEGHAVNEERYAVPHVYSRSESRPCTKRVSPDDPCVLRPASRISDEHQRSAKTIALYHFATKSWEDFKAKLARGGGTLVKGRTSAYFRHWQRLATTRGGVCAEPSKLADACCPK